MGIRKFYLMNKNQKILSFTSERNEYGEVLLEEVEQYSQVLPLGYGDIQSFIEHRQAPKHRKHIQRLLRETNCEDLEGFLLVSKALSLNDTYWVKSVEGQETWENVSLYRNDFNEVIAQLAFMGDTTCDISCTSPEFVTDGLYAKCWIWTADGIQLVKTGSETYGIEPVCESLASQIAEQICPSSVAYKLGNWHGRQASFCNLFTDEKIGYIPAKRLLQEGKSNKISSMMDFYESRGWGDSFRRMLVLDALILNEDRHAGNYGFWVDNDQQKILSPAPVFDHNRSMLFSYKGDKENFSALVSHIKGLTPRIGNDFNQTAHQVLTEDIKKDLQKLRDFSFDRDALADVSEEMVHVLEQLVKHQVENVLKGNELYYFKW